jgi:patatin-like phospholipase/acyl hydrolase
LSLDGGGLRGIFSAAVLAGLEDDLGTTITDHFDLIAGTSTGGIIALGLGLGMRPREIVELYADLGPRVFGGPPGVRSIRRMVRPKHNAADLRSVLAEAFGERTLGESSKRLVITSYNLSSDDIYLFRTPHLSHLKRDWKASATDVALATAAAPTYFSCHRLANTRLVDGGLWANNPSLVALIEATGPLGVPMDAIRMFSLGTTGAAPFRHRRLDRGGILPWAMQTVPVIMRAQSIGVTNQVRHLITPERLLRLDPVVSARAVSLDRVDAEELMGRGAHESRIVCPAFEELFAGHRADPYIPCHRTETAR